MDIRKHRFVPTMKTATRVFSSKKQKRSGRRFLNNPKNWE